MAGKPGKCNCGVLWSGQAIYPRGSLGFCMGRGFHNNTYCPKKGIFIANRPDPPLDFSWSLISTITNPECHYSMAD